MRNVPALLHHCGPLPKLFCNGLAGGWVGTFAAVRALLRDGAWRWEANLAPDAHWLPTPRHSHPVELLAQEQMLCRFCGAPSPRMLRTFNKCPQLAGFGPTALDRAREWRGLVESRRKVVSRRTYPLGRAARKSRERISCKSNLMRARTRDRR